MLAWYDRAKSLGFHPLCVDSNGNGGFRVFIIFNAAIPSELAFHFIRWLQRDWQEFRFATMPEAFPKQERLGLIDKTGEHWAGCGNWVRMFGRHHKRDHYTRFWDGTRWIAGEDAIKFLLEHKGDDPALIPAEVHDLVKTANEQRAAKALAKSARQGKQPHSVGEPHEYVVTDPTRDAALAAEALGYIRHMAEDYGDRDNPGWLQVGMSLHCLGSIGLDLWDQWSQTCPEKHEPGVCDYKWETFDDDGGITLGSLFYWAKEAGWKPSRPEDVDPVEHWLLIHGQGHLIGLPPSQLNALLSPSDNGLSSPSGNGLSSPSGNGVPQPPADLLGSPPLQCSVLAYNCTDLGNAERLVARHGDKIRFCHPWGKWLVWDGKRWKVDDTAAVRRLAKDTVRQVIAEANLLDDKAQRRALIQWGLQSESRKAIDDMLKLAASEPGIPVLPDELDQSPWLLNVANGTIDLKQRVFYAHRQSDMLTQLCPTAYDCARDMSPVG